VNTLEGRLRDAYQAAGQTVRSESIRGLHDRAVQAARPGLRPASPARSRRIRVLVPLAAAAAVALIAVAASVLQPASSPGHGRGGTTASGTPPRFFLALPSQHQDGDIMAVFSATTGRQLALVRPPRGSVIDTAAATGNDRTFVVTVQFGSRCSTTTLYRLRLTARGTPSVLAPLAIPKISGVVTAMAASSDGRTIAYATAFCGTTSASPGAIGVVQTGTVQTRQWAWRPNPGQSVGSLSVTADGRLIEYAASPNKVTSPSSGQILPVRTIRLLPADAPPGSATQRSRAAVTISRQAPAELFSSAAIAPDGRTLYFCTQRNPDHPARSALVLRGYDVATAATSVVRTFDWRGAYCMLGASGNSLLVGLGNSSPGHHPRLARYDVATGKLTPVPVPRQWDEVASNIPW
jgi:WD40-like Beta Propeller Repeat